MIIFIRAISYSFCSEWKNNYTSEKIIHVLQKHNEKMHLKICVILGKFFKVPKIDQKLELNSPSYCPFNSEQNEYNIDKM